MGRIGIKRKKRRHEQGQSSQVVGQVPQSRDLLKKPPAPPKGTRNVAFSDRAKAMQINGDNNKHAQLIRNNTEFRGEQLDSDVKTIIDIVQIGHNHFSIYG